MLSKKIHHDIVYIYGCWCVGRDGISVKRDAEIPVESDGCSGQTEWLLLLPSFGQVAWSGCGRMSK